MIWMLASARPLREIADWVADLVGARVMISVYSVKRAAVAEARRRAKTVQRHGGLAQMRVHGQNGQLQFESTYGADPKRYRS